MQAGTSTDHDRSRYEGKNLLLLLLALFGPALILFLVLALRVINRLGRAHPSASSSYVLLAVFLVTELVSARYVQRLLPAADSRLRDALNYLGVLALCLFTSYCAAVVCEAFGYEVLLRLSQPR